MQFNLVNDQEQVAQFVRRGVALCGVLLQGMALALGFIAGGAWSIFSAGVLLVCGVLSQGVFKQF